jgi:hypothetical protein
VQSSADVESGVSKRMLVVIGVLVLVVVLFAVQNNKKTAAQTTSPTGCQMQVTADVLNVRATADGKAKVVGKLTTGAVTAAQKTVQNGYRELGTGRWVSNQFLKQVSGAC